MDLKVLIFCYGAQNFQDFQSWSPNTSLSNLDIVVYWESGLSVFCSKCWPVSRAKYPLPNKMYVCKAKTDITKHQRVSTFCEMK
jgi:hypothetical protein